MTKEDKIAEFLTNVIDQKDLAQHLRRFTLQAIRITLENPDIDGYRLDWIATGHFWLAELCEILDPQLETEDN